MGQKKFIKLDLELLQKYGDRAAILYAFLVNLSQVWEKDRRGYMGIWTQYISDQLGWSKNTIYRTQEKLIKEKLIVCETGKNQNSQPKYKVL